MLFPTVRTENQSIAYWPANSSNIAKILDNYQNRRQMIRYVGPPDMELPEEDARRWVQGDLVLLVEQKAIPTEYPDPMNPMVPKIVNEPSIEPNWDLLRDYADQSIEAVVVYLLRNGTQLKKEAPDGFENALAYLTKLRMLQQSAMAPPMPGGPGPGAGAGSPPPVPQLPAGAVQPGPVPPVPGALVKPLVQ